MTVLIKTVVKTMMIMMMMMMKLMMKVDGDYGDICTDAGKDVASTQMSFGVRSNEPQRTSAGRLVKVIMIMMTKLVRQNQ